MDILKWIQVWNDPLGEARASVVITAVVFLIGCFVLLRIAKWLVARAFGIAVLDGLAQLRGYKDYHDLFMETVHLGLWFSCVFLAGVMFYYFFTQTADLKESFGSASIVLAERQCETLNGTMQCIQRTSSNSPLLNFSIGGPINHSGYSGENVDK